jgi:membrane-associated phospholipid phosphatase
VRHLGALALLVLAFPAAARERLTVDPAVDVPVTAAAAAIWFLPEPPVPAPYDPGVAPHGLDGLAPTHPHAAAANASDAVLQIALWGGLAVSGIDGALDGDLPGRLLLQVEAAAIAGALTSITKAAATRPRPYTYGDHRVVRPADQVSFFSGHTSATAAAAFAAARGLDLTGDGSTGERVLLYGGAGLITAAVGTLRVAAGQHFPTDVIAGALVGGAVGFLVPELHRAAPGLTVGGGPDHLVLAMRF